MPTHIQELSPYFQKNLSGPLTDNERSYYHSLVQKRDTNTELMYIIAKFSTFLFNKQSKYGPVSSKTTQNSADSSFTVITASNNTPPVVTFNTFNFQPILYKRKINTSQTTCQSNGSHQKHFLHISNIKKLLFRCFTDERNTQ